MITRVLDHRGQVLHDCADAGCTVSWDGYAIVDVPDVPNPQAAEPGQQETITIPAGQAMPGRQDPGDHWQVVDGHTVQALPPELPA